MAFAVLYLPLVAEFGGSRAEVAAVQSAVLLLGGAAGPLVGWALDRLGPRRLFQAGAVLAAAALAAASRAESLPALIAAYGIAGGLGLAALGSQANLVVAALWYPGARGRAIALADLGTGFGAFCFIPLGQALVSPVGWRGTLLAWAGLLLGVVVPLNVFQRAAARFFGACAFPLMNTHLIAYAVGQGVAPATAATALGTVSLVSLAGRLPTGWLCDRIGRAPALTVAYASAAAGIGCAALLAATGSPLWLALYVVLYGMAQGSSGSYLGAFAFAVAALAAGLAAIWRVRPDPRRSTYSSTW